MQSHPIALRSGTRARVLAGLFAATAALGGWSCAAGPGAETAPSPQPEAHSDAATAPETPAHHGGALERAVADVFNKQDDEPDEFEMAEQELESRDGDRAKADANVGIQPPDGKWLVDEEGRQYFVREIPKIEGHYRRLEDGRVRVQGGFTVDLAGETDDFFLVKFYQVEPVEPPPSDEPTPEEIAEVEGSYEVSLPTGQTLSYREFDRGLARGGQWRNGFDVADLDGDGYLDIVHGPPRKGFTSPFIFLGDGTGTWRQWQGLSMPEAPYSYGDAEAADFDGDGHMDLAFAVHLGGLIVMRGNGQGTFERWSDGLELLPAGRADKETFLSRTIGSADWDDDGLPDLVALSEGPRHPKATERFEVDTPNGLAVFRNDGDGSWTSLGRLGEDEGLFGDSLSLGDFDGDGRVDLVTGSNALGRRELLFLNREGTSVEAVRIEAIRPSSIVWAVEAADFDGDGRDDLAVAATAYQVGDWWGSLQVLLNRPAEDGAPAFIPVPLTGGRDKAIQRVTAIGAGDVNADGAVDLVASTATGTVWVFIGDGNGGFTREEAGPVDDSDGCRGYHVRLADLDNDGADEILANFAGDSCPGAGSFRVWKVEAK